MIQFGIAAGVNVPTWIWFGNYRDSRFVVRKDVVCLLLRCGDEPCWTVRSGPGVRMAEQGCCGAVPVARLPQCRASIRSPAV